MNDMDLNLHHLRVFLAVAECGSVSGAAARLGVSQPAVSRQAASLEGAVGMRLFDRLARGIRLTEAGVALADQARRLFAVERDARRALDELASLERGRVSVGASLTIGGYWLPRVVARFTSLYPGVRVEVTVGNTHEIQRRLELSEFDFALTEGFVESEAFTATVFARDRLVLVAAPGHALAAGVGVTAAEVVASGELVLREPGSGTRAVVERALGLEAGFVARLSLGSTEAIKSFVGAGVGVAMMSEMAVRTEVEDGRLVEVSLEGLEVWRDLHLLRVAERSQGRAEAELLRLVMSGGG